MNVYINNINYLIDSGNTTFAKKLLWHLSVLGEINIVKKQSNANIEFCQSTEDYSSVKPRITVFSDAIEYLIVNDASRKSFQKIQNNSAALIFNSEFYKIFFEKNYEIKIPTFCIKPAVHSKMIDEIVPFELDKNFKNSNIWITKIYASDEERSMENINYFIADQFENNESSTLLVLGRSPSKEFESVYESNKNIFFLGKVPWESFVSMLKIAKKYVHLKFMSDFSMSLAEAQYCGCEIVTVDSGANLEIITSGKVISDEEYSKENISDAINEAPMVIQNDFVNVDKDIKSLNFEETAREYLNIFERFKGE